MKIVIIGGGACGASCAARLRRLDEEAEIVILEKTNEVSIANCGLPYYCSDVINEREKILVFNPQKFKSLLNVEAKTNAEVVHIDKDDHFVTLQSGEKISYDKLVLAMGASPIIPPFAGMNKEKVFSVRTLEDADTIKSFIKTQSVKKAVVIGGGFIGVEMAENFIEMGLETSLIELQNQILAPVDGEVVAFAQNEMRDNGVELILGDGVKEFEGDFIVLNSGNKVAFDIVIMAIGVKPEITLAKNAGLEVNRGIKVNECMQTTDPDIYAGGDSVEIKDFVTNNDVLIPLAGPANRQGRIIADNIMGYNSTYKKSQGTAVLKVFDYTVASVGNNEKQLLAQGTTYHKTFVFGNSHAGYYPNATPLMIKLLFSQEGRIFGAQAVGEKGVEKRIDVIATVMRNQGTVQELMDAELCYAPPFSSAKDPINILGMNADNMLKGLVKAAYLEDLENAFVIDVRPKAMFDLKHYDGAVNIPISEMRDRLAEIPKDKKVVTMCSIGFNSYIAYRLLSQHGFDNVLSYMGGFSLYKELDKNSKAGLEPNLKKKVSELSQEKTVAKSSEQVLSQTGKVLKIDACGLQCPGPIMKVAETIAEAENTDIIEVLSTDKGFKSDIEAWTESTGNTLLDITQENKIIKARIQKGMFIASDVSENRIVNTANGQTIVVFSNDLDKALAALIIANGAKASGKEVSLFFTFWGLNILRKSNLHIKKGFIDSMFGLMMPKGAEKLSLSKMNMGGIGTMMMKWVMKNKNVNTLTELITQAQNNGVKFIACNMSMDIMGITEEELIPNVELGGVAKYIAESDKANANLFI